MTTDPPIPEVDYRSTSRRPGWAELPRRVRVAVERTVGARVLHADPPVTSGFTGGAAMVVDLAGGRRAFVKAGHGANPHVPRAYAKEAWVLERLPAHVPAPRLLGHCALAAGEAGPFEWQIVVLEALPGSMPDPWSEQSLAAVHEACVAAATALTPVPAGLATGISTMVVEYAGDPQIRTAFANLAAGRRTPPEGQPRWLPDRYADLQAVVETAGDALTGDTACHGDLRADNVLIDGQAAVIVDWNWPSRGPAWADFVGLLPLARTDGVDVDAWLARSPLTGGVDPEHVDAWLAVIAGYMLMTAPQPLWAGALPALRAHQRRYARLFLDWLAVRRGWG